MKFAERMMALSPAARVDENKRVRRTQSVGPWVTSAVVAIVLTIGLLTGSPAQASNCSPTPNTFTNGTVADATQVNANFTNLLNCANNNLAHNGANSDITSISGLTTPLAISQGGSGNSSIAVNQTFVGNGSNSVAPSTLPSCPDSANNHLNYNNSTQAFSCGSTSSGLHAQSFPNSGAWTFTIPSNATSATVFEFAICGGGGGGGGASTTSGAVGGGGASGSCVSAWFHGFSASQTVTITVGTNGSGGAAGAAGGTGGTSTIVYSSTTIMSATGGTGGQGGTALGIRTGGGMNGVTTSPGATGLTMDATTNVGNQGSGSWGSFGIGASTNGYSGQGGNCPLGAGALPQTSAGAGFAGFGSCAGGAGALRASTDVAGGAGAGGIAIVEWSL